MSNTEMNKPTLKHTYYGLRHAESIPNTKKIIVSSFEEGEKQENSLSPKGIQQALDILGRDKVELLCSDFSRTIQTASIIKDKLFKQTNHNSELQLRKELRERFFGIYELKENKFYQTVWDNDASFNETENDNNNVERVSRVFERVKNLIAWAEENISTDKIVLVSHGDTLQITQCFFEGIDPHNHRSLPHLETCELRQLNNK